MPNLKKIKNWFKKLKIKFMIISQTKLNTKKLKNIVDNWKNIDIITLLGKSTNILVILYT